MQGAPPVTNPLHDVIEPDDVTGGKLVAQARRKTFRRVAQGDDGAARRRQPLELRPHVQSSPSVERVLVVVVRREVAQPSRQRPRAGACDRNIDAARQRSSRSRGPTPQELVQAHRREFDQLRRRPCSSSPRCAHHVAQACRVTGCVAHRCHVAIHGMKPRTWNYESLTSHVVLGILRTKQNVHISDTRVQAANCTERGWRTPRSHIE